MGFFNSLKVNLFAFTQLTYEKDKWYKFDVLFDWEKENVAFFLDDEFKFIVKFYSYERDAQMLCAESFANALILYTLSPGVQSAFKQIRLCS